MFGLFPERHGSHKALLTCPLKILQDRGDTGQIYQRNLCHTVPSSQLPALGAYMHVPKCQSPGEPWETTAP